MRVIMDSAAESYMKKPLSTALAIITSLGLILSLIAWELHKKNYLSTKTNELEFWQYWSGTEKEPLEKLIAKFNSQNHGFKVKLLTISMPRKKILTAVAGRVAPDLVHLDGDMVSDFALRNAITELDPLLNIEKNKFTPVYLDMLNIHGKQFAMPMMPNAEALHINQKLLTDHSLTVPQTLDDIVRIFDEMNSGDSTTSLGWLPSWPPWAGQFIPIVFGGHWGTKDTDGVWHITANDPRNIQAWTWVQENFARKIPPQQMSLFTEGYQAYQSPDNPFYAGKIALENNGVWEKNLAEIYAPHLDIVVRPFPGLIENATQVSVDAIAIPHGAKHPEQAAKFITWLLTQENLEYLALTQKKFTPLVNHSQSFFAQHSNPYIKTFIDLANSANAVYFPQVKFSARYKREIRNAYNKVLRMETNPEEALNGLQKKFTES